MQVVTESGYTKAGKRVPAKTMSNIFQIKERCLVWFICYGGSEGPDESEMRKNSS